MLYPVFLVASVLSKLNRGWAGTNESVFRSCIFTVSAYCNGGLVWMSCGLTGGERPYGSLVS